jgi:tetratricopeptide (TPR) repeat protein
MRLPAEQWWNVYSALREVADWRRARFAAECMLEAIDPADNTASRRLRYVAQTFLAEALARHPESKEDFRLSYELSNSALGITRALAKELDTPEARRDVSVSLDNVANAARARGDLAGAERLFAESLELSRALAKELDTPEARRDVSVSLIQMAEIAMLLDDASRAITLLSEARVAAEEFGGIQPMSDAKDIIDVIDGMLNRLIEQ